MRFLIADNDQALGLFLVRGMEAEGYDVTLTQDGKEALAKLEQVSPDLVILELNLPKRDGMDVLRAMRAWRRDLAIVVLTSRTDIDTRIACLDLGADDFIAKPFSMRELRARCRALLRRRQNGGSEIVRSGPLELNRIDRSVTKEGEPISLTNKEFSLLECLMNNAGQCVSRASLLANVWQTQAEANTNVVDVYINYLRRKLGDTRTNPLIQTVRGVGYTISSTQISRVSKDDVASAGLDSAVAQQIDLGTWGTYGNSRGTQHLDHFAGQL